MAQSSARVALYASVGPDLTQYDVDVGGAALVRSGTVNLPANVQYAWPHASGRYLYVASSDSQPGVGPPGEKHHVTAFRVAPVSGALSAHGDPIALPSRPIHMTTDTPSEHLLVAFSNPSGIRVYRVNPDATPGTEVDQPASIDPGIYGHQVRVSLDNRLAILVTCGHDPAADGIQHLANRGAGDTQDTRSQTDAGQQGDGGDGGTAFLENDREIDAAEGAVTTLGGQGEFGPAQVDDRLPHGPPAFRIGHRLPGDSGRALGAQDVSHAVTQRQLTGIQSDVHKAPNIIKIVN